MICINGAGMDKEARTEVASGQPTPIQEFLAPKFHNFSHVCSQSGRHTRLGGW